jgi:hypothetical protein
MASPTLAELEKHAKRFGTRQVLETASSNGLRTSELRQLQLRLFEIEQQQPKRRRRVRR